nr:JAB domain-containing protein [Sphingomonas lycopersici]
MLRSRLARRPILSNEPALLDYPRFAMAFDPVERFRILFLNATNELVADELMAIGTVAAVQIYPREVVKRCLEVGATAMLLVHNHPSGNPIPSAADRAMTRRLAQPARYFDIMIHDHLVIARDGVTSFRREGYL